MSLLEECHREIKKLIKRFENLIVVLICDREGASVLKVLNESSKDDSFTLKNFITQKLITCTENVTKLELGSCSKIAVQYEDYQMVTFNNAKLVVTLIANNQIDTGTLLSLENEFNIICNSLQDYID